MVLVTGASGFVGAHFTKQLSENGRQVRALYHRDLPPEWMLNWKGVSWMHADLLDIYDVEAAMKDVSEVYHCAAIVSFVSKRNEEIIHANTEMACNVVNAALDEGIRKMIHISSVAALGRNGVSKTINEEAQWEESQHNSGYGKGKYGAEIEVWRGIGEGLDACILNPGIILGASILPKGWEEGSPKLITTAFKSFPFFTDGITGFVAVEDVVNAALLLMDSTISGERFILSSGDFGFKTIFEKMADALGKKRPHIHAGALTTSLVWRWSSFKSRFTGATPLITQETARNAQTKSFYDGQKILKSLPAFSYTPISESIKKMANAYLEFKKVQ